jgi:hypothetical protein
MDAGERQTDESKPLLHAAMGGEPRENNEWVL